MYIMKSSIVINIIVCVLIILGILCVLGVYNKEAFSSTLLPYQKKKNTCGLSNHRYSTKLASKSNMADYSQKTNNKRYWSTPCNGSILLPEMCGGLYKNTEVNIPGQVLPPTDLTTRVNFYDTSSI